MNLNSVILCKDCIGVVRDMFHYCTPQLPVKDVVKTQEYYRDVLGFKIDWLWEDNFGCVSNGKVQLFFCKNENPIVGCCCYLDAEDVEAVYEKYKQNGANIVHGLEFQPWGMHEFVIQDIDGHFHRIGQETTELPQACTMELAS